MNKQLITSLVALCIYSMGAAAQVVRITKTNEEKAKEIVSKMTLVEKLRIIGGELTFSIEPVPRLGLPAIHMADGPQGIRNETKSTMYPAGICVAASWNRALAHSVGVALGQDAKARGRSILLGPGVNIYRAPMCGRNFEYFGEDPYLTGETAKNYILGVQSQGVMATIKHFVANNQEWDRHSASSNVDERTLNEIYFPSFKKAVQEAYVGAIMSSYNPVNEKHMAENGDILIDVVRKKWGFKGIVMSDWESTYSTLGTVANGLDLEKPVGKWMNAHLIMPLLKRGVINEQMIDEKVQHIIQTLLAFNMYDTPQQDKSIALDNANSKKAALAMAREGLVLLKNKDDILPLKGPVAVMGPNANIVPTGGGSGFVEPYSTITTWEGLKGIYGKNATFISEDERFDNEADHFYTDATLTRKGFTATYYNNEKLEGTPVLSRRETKIDYNWKLESPAQGVPADHFSVRWTAVYKPVKSGDVDLFVKGDDGYRLFVDDKELIADWTVHAATIGRNTFYAEAGRTYRIRVEYYEGLSDACITARFTRNNPEKMLAQVAKAKNVVLCVGFDSATESEGKDRTFALPEGQNELINEIAARNKNVIVVLNAGGGVDFEPWIDNVKAVLMVWYPGQEGGKAIAEILLGKISPSGKLPMTMEKRWEDNPVHDNYYYNKAADYSDGRATTARIHYNEGVFVGYRGYEQNGVKPRFAFGHGLSYTTFAYSNLKVEPSGTNQVRVSFDIKNTGKHDGAEVAQVYVHDVDASVPRPYKELKGYDKVFLKRGETKRVTIELKADAFSFYDIKRHDFVVEPGEFEILVGSSSDHIVLKDKINL
ncbi:putative beta-glucosidase [Hoylesella saccharolytica F0055]|uniref:Putative beta-glucosidase n=1 Tax=Hoylesella saccharolytica F0055 TaxID=1127699 RepID=L1NLN3_9BACT|nr:glycoside hydrolase family 3 protein [Hoylesella saccharolytica]EKY04092.1 putative beta-glucosidase [Hoylesella saccharolytica F0055]